MLRLDWCGFCLFVKSSPINVLRSSLRVITSPRHQVSSSSHHVIQSHHQVLTSIALHAKYLIQRIYAGNCRALQHRDCVWHPPVASLMKDVCRGFYVTSIERSRTDICKRRPSVTSRKKAPKNNYSQHRCALLQHGMRMEHSSVNSSCMIHVIQTSHRTSLQYFGVRFARDNFSQSCAWNIRVQYS